MSTTKQTSTPKPVAQKPVTTTNASANTVIEKPAVTQTASKPVVKATVSTKAVETKATVAKPSIAVASKKKVAVSKVAKVEKEKVPKLKMERDSFTMPKAEYAQIYVLKDRLVKLGQPAKKSELLRAGLMLLTALTDANLKAAMGKIPTIKTGRPKK